MGANSICCIPNDTDPEDIVLAIAYLCGATRARNEFRHNREMCFSAHFDRKEVSVDAREKLRKYKVFVQPTHKLTFFTIHVSPTYFDREWHQGSLFINSVDNPGYHEISGGVNEFWHKVGKELVKMFGGKVDYDDCDSIDWDFAQRKPRKSNHPTNGKPWQDFQQALFDLPTLFHFVEKK